MKHFQFETFQKIFRYLEESMPSSSVCTQDDRCPSISNDTNWNIPDVNIQNISNIRIYMLYSIFVICGRGYPILRSYSTIHNLLEQVPSSTGEAPKRPPWKWDRTLGTCSTALMQHGRASRAPRSVVMISPLQSGRNIFRLIRQVRKLVWTLNQRFLMSDELVSLCCSLRTGGPTMSRRRASQ